MRGAVLQLHRWGLLETIRAAGTPAIRSTTFHYGDETIEVPIKARDGIDALCAPRRTVLDPVLIDAALAAGAEVVHGRAVVDVLRDSQGRVRGVKIGGADEQVMDVEADLVIGADGIRSRVARIVEAPLDYTVPHMSCSIYGYWSGVAFEGYHWFYDIGVSVGSIPTNGGETCVFILLPQPRFEKDRRRGMEALYRDALDEVSPELAGSVAESDGPGRLRAFAGATGFLRRAVGPGWALVGDAGYFRDPITAHGITDALHDAELLSRAVAGSDGAMAGYQAARDERVKARDERADRGGTNAGPRACGVAGDWYEYRHPRR
jgi:2-polyprenyl-6-methoxyphenol hydroxylase-like FAD-dependent oxidoreductase